LIYLSLPNRLNKLVTAPDSVTLGIAVAIKALPQGNLYDIHNYIFYDYKLLGPNLLSLLGIR